MSCTLVDLLTYALGGLTAGIGAGYLSAAISAQRRHR